VSASRLFPRVDDEATFHAEIRADDRALRRGVDAICARHDLGGAGVTRFPTGSVPVYAIGQTRVLKLFPPHDREHFEIERSVLSALPATLPLRAPALETSGTLDDWSYVLMERLAGHPLSEVWSKIPPTERPALFETIGAGLAALHAIQVDAIPAVRTDWSGFITRQRTQCVERQRAHHLGAEWLDQIADFLDRTSLPTPARLALLHTEVMREHILAAPTPTGWKLTGIVDFEPAMSGAPEYELASVGVFTTCATPLLRPLLLAYGYAPHELDAALQQRLCAYALLHRYSKLSWYLDRVPPPRGVTTLRDLAAHWWSFA
jgi:hygromycin-B 7''-O-kinase